MKLCDISNLSYCSLILLFGSVSAILNSPEPSDSSEISPVSPWSPPKEASRLLKWTTDPRHAWWKGAGSSSFIKRNPSPVATQQIVIPTKCQYVAANTDPVCSHGCICKTSCDSIYIWNVSRPEPRPQYHICTNWVLNHANQLRQGFHEAGFQVAPEFNRTKCGWMKFTHVSAMRVGRGSIDVNGTLDDPYGIPAELVAIEDVMVAEYPFVEILIICATLVGPIFIFGGAIGWCVYADGNRKVKYRSIKQ